ncbi:MAG: hypothetical protein IJJ45_07830 [Clostridia bacterium]|nr:hypothetical protein [Clostridia bacterium]
MKRKHRRLVQVLAIVLVVLLVGGVIVSALIAALAEGQTATTPERDRYELAIEYIDDRGALHIGQRLVYGNRWQKHLDRVLFYAMPNMLRRQTALMYEPDDLSSVFPGGHAPGGIELASVRVDGEDADYGYEGTDELVLRVACDLRPGEKAVFEFDYYLALPYCRAFVGIGDLDVRLSAFYFIPGIYDPDRSEFVLNQPLSFTRWLYSGPADYDVRITIPDGYALASVGVASKEGGVWQIHAENVREYAVAFGRRWREKTRETQNGPTIRLFSRLRDPDRILDIVSRAISFCKGAFADDGFPVDQLTIVESDTPLDALDFPGLILLPSRLFDRGSGSELEKQLRFCVAQQYIGISAYTEPSADAWLSDSICEYMSYLMLESEEGQDAFLKAINRDWVSALQLTIPGGLRITSDAKQFDSREYDIVVRKRGAVVFHELRCAMGLEAFLDGIARFYKQGRTGGTLTEMDLVACMDAASNRSWEDFLTDWVFNVDEYVNQHIDWFE